MTAAGRRRLGRTWVAYGLGIAAGAVFLRWLEWTHALRVFPTEIYVAAVALAFTVLGVWIGRRLTGPRPATPFARNEEALRYLGVSDREYEVLGLLAEGRTNREIAERLFLSPHTIKSHVAHLYAKLEVSRRTEAVQKARSLRLIP